MSPRRSPTPAAGDDGPIDATYTIDDPALGTPSTALDIRPAGRAAGIERYSALGEQAKAYARQSRARRTLLAYDSDWRNFVAWCEREDRQSLPASPETVGDYISALAGAHRKITTIERRLSTISQRHQLNGFESPCQTEIVRTILKGIRRDPSTNKHSAAKAAIELEQLRRMLAALERHPHQRVALRDKALLLLMFCGALRRSEAAGIELEHVKFGRKGMIISLPQSKTSQEAAVEITIANGAHKETCPVRALQAWIKAADIRGGRLFLQSRKGGHITRAAMSDRAIAEMIKRWCAAVGADPAEYGGHSLRAGFVTEADKRGVSERIGMQHTRHRTERVYRSYARGNHRWEDSPTVKLGL